MKFDEFSRSLLDKGLGTDRSLSKDVFDNLVDPSKPNVAQLDILFDYISKYQFKDDAKPAVGGKNARPAKMGVSRVDRRFREALRKSFTQMKSDLTAKGKDGYVDSDVLYTLIVRNCMPLTYQDFRLMIQQFDLQNGGSRVNYEQFLNAYNPLNTVHILDGADATKKLAASVSLKNNSNSDNASVTTVVDSVYDGNESVVSSYNSNTIRRSSSSTSGVDMRKIWQSVLRECHKNDHERSGLVNRIAFISALSAADQSMTPQMVNELADEYTLSQGLVDYLSCFRTYLNDMVGSMSQSKSQVAFNESELKKNPLVRDKGALHPWEFSQGKTKTGPYWKQAITDKREPPPEPIVVPPPNKKSANELTPQEKQALMGKYSDSVLQTCNKCCKYFLPVWRDVRNDFKKGQISSQRGSILTTNFYLILDHYGVKLGKNDMEGLVRGFRGLGMQDVVQFDEFLRVCLLVKDKKSGQGAITIATHNN
jgi:Ca2+-binding EF-hand superfamily protein